MLPTRAQASHSLDRLAGCLTRITFSLLLCWSCLRLHFTHPEKIKSVLVLLFFLFFACAPLPAGLALTPTDRR